MKYFSKFFALFHRCLRAKALDTKNASVLFLLLLLPYHKDFLDFRSETTYISTFVIYFNHGGGGEGGGKRAGYSVFGVQYAGECWSGPLAHVTYKKYGTATNCVNGTGGFWAQDVYRIVSK